MSTEVIAFFAVSMGISILLKNIRKNEQMKKLSRVSLPSYERYQFTTSPVFGDEFIVGNLNQIVESIEEHILKSMAIGKNYKENLPFHCIINPPRHGKSLLLDRLFLNNEDVLVIGITYNSTTGLIEGETDNLQSALKWFWIRVLKSMLQISEPLDTLSNLLQPNQCSWPHIKSIIISGLSSNPFIDKNGKEKNILFCIDEFSLLSDKFKTEWNEDQQKKFISELHQIKQASYPFIQFVMTGFQLTMNELLASSSSNNTYTLELCDFSISRPLLRKVLEEYEAKKVPFPVSLFEIIKSTPGLIGYWAELIERRHVYCRSIYEFAKHMQWLVNITRFRENYCPLKSNWCIIFNYLKYLVTEQNEDTVRIGRLIVAAEIGICYPTPEIIPLCFAVITSLGHSRRIGDNPLQDIILNHFSHLFHLYDVIDPNDANRDEVPFEELTITALHIRLLLWVQTKIDEEIAQTKIDVNNNPEQRVQILFRSFLPSSESFSGYHPQFRSKLSVHLIRTKESLRKLLIPPLYNIFPLGIKSLNEKWDQINDSTLLALIDSNTQEYQLHQILNKNNSVIDISSKIPTKTKQSVICKLKDWNIDTTVAFELFNRMKEGETSENIKTTLDGKDQTWWNKLKALVAQLKKSIDGDHSLISTADSAQGADLLIIWKQSNSDDFNDLDDLNVESNVNDEVIHIAALELKDQRQTPLDEWESKWDSLMSPHCILHWMPLFYPDLKFSLHFIFAGREHSSLKFRA